MKEIVYATSIGGKNLSAGSVSHDNNAVPVNGTRLLHGQVRCGKCGGKNPDSDIKGLLPSCSTCWVAIKV